MAERRVGIDQGHGRPIAQCLVHRAHVEAAAPEFLVIRGEHRDTVGVDAAQIGLEHHLGRGVGVSFGHAPGAKNGEELLANLRRGDPRGGGHRTILPPFLRL